MQQAKEGHLQDSCHSDRMLDGLQLRFALVGGVFEVSVQALSSVLLRKEKNVLQAFQRNSSATTDWALLLVQLVTHGIIDLHTNSELFTTVIDMLATLIHSALATDTQVRLVFIILGWFIISWGHRTTVKKCTRT